MQTSVQLTFSFEITAVQLTPTFKMGVLQVRPISKIVTMRVAPSQQPQLEVSFEIAKIQPVGETLGTIRMTPSQQQRPNHGFAFVYGRGTATRAECRVYAGPTHAITAGSGGCLRDGPMSDYYDRVFPVV
jgi:hypothetical protein